MIAGMSFSIYDFSDIGYGDVEVFVYNGVVILLREGYFVPSVAKTKLDHIAFIGVSASEALFKDGKGWRKDKYQYGLIVEFLDIQATHNIQIENDIVAGSQFGIYKIPTGSVEITMNLGPFIEGVFLYKFMKFCFRNKVIIATVDLVFALRATGYRNGITESGISVQQGSAYRALSATGRRR